MAVQAVTKQIRKVLFQYVLTTFIMVQCIGMHPQEMVEVVGKRYTNISIRYSLVLTYLYRLDFALRPLMSTFHYNFFHPYTRI